ncbi:hypothetical protein [Streptomyces beihaiensis]|uniref:Neocarzinostatin family protein n=1 Tax=Streptomyces beihaiensis TaxID=2984495 RepID=A0ABT3U268_9ACTN|nr:hypothetical protein [Streptomyces beihaiensis]MCX3063401.1 hypothetical protein [Streptomyces beihaiensis]
MKRRSVPGPWLLTGRVLAVLAVAVALLVGTAAWGTGAEAGARAQAAGRPSVTLSKSQAGAGGSITVRGAHWRPRTLLMMLICGQSSPSRGVIGGTNSCANSEGRAVTTGADGSFNKRMPVAEPPAPCPCVVHVATVTGPKAQVDAVFKVAGHPVEALPEPTANGRLSMVTDTRLDGSSGLLTWFGAPPSRTLTFTVGNVGSSPVKDPVFKVGSAHGVFAPQWDEQQWRGTIEPGRKARIRLPVELSAGAHGDYLISLKYDGKLLAEQPWGVGRPWGVTLFWILLCVVVPAAVFRVGMAIVNKLSPRERHSRAHASGGRRAAAARRLAERLAGRTVQLPRVRLPQEPPPAREGTARRPTASADRAHPTTTALPWFTPDSGPAAPEDTSPTTRPTTHTTEGTT